jgi:hypothetical protein
MPRLKIAGLDLSDVSFARIIAAFRGLYPDLTAGVSDDRALQNAFKQIIVQHVATWESRQAGPDPSTAAIEASAAAAHKRKEAEDSSRLDMESDIKPTTEK